MANDSSEKGSEQASHARDSVDASNLQAEFLKDTSWSDRDSSSGKEERNMLAEKTNALESNGTLPKLEIGNSKNANDSKDKSSPQNDGNQAKPSNDSKAGPSNSKDAAHLQKEISSPPLTKHGNSNHANKGSSFARQAIQADIQKQDPAAIESTGQLF